MATTRSSAIPASKLKNEPIDYTTTSTPSPANDRRAEARTHNGPSTKSPKPSTRPSPKDTDQHGIERIRKDNPGFVDRMRMEHSWFDHLMHMNERFGEQGGNQYAAGITYFSVLSMFPILMLVFATMGFVLANNPEALQQVQEKISSMASGDMGETLNQVLTTAIEQRGTIAGIGALTALWSGLGWMSNLRYGVSKMWNVDPGEGNFVVNKLKDLIGLIGLLISMILAFGVTAIGASGLTMRLLDMIGLAHIPGIVIIARVIALVVAMLANFVVFFWMIKFMPRTKVPMKSAIHAAMIGAVAFEVFKQLATVFFANGLKNPAGAAFGPIIGLMVLLYFVWRIVLYCNAWAATTEESLAIAVVPVPEPAVIRVRHEVNHTPKPAASAAILGTGAALGSALAAVAFRRKR